MSRLMSKLKLKWAIPIVVCYWVVGFFVFAVARNPELQLVCALSILATVLVTMAVVVGLTKG